jgi:hypothetical protein
MPFRSFRITQAQKSDLESLVKIIATYNWADTSSRQRDTITSLYEKMVINPECRKYFEFYQVYVLNTSSFSDGILLRMHENIGMLRRIYPSIAVH